MGIRNTKCTIRERKCMDSGTRASESLLLDAVSPLMPYFKGLGTGAIPRDNDNDNKTVLYAQSQCIHHTQGLQ